MMIKFSTHKRRLIIVTALLFCLGVFIHGVVNLIFPETKGTIREAREAYETYRDQYNERYGKYGADATDDGRAVHLKQEWYELADRECKMRAELRAINRILKSMEVPNDVTRSGK